MKKSYCKIFTMSYDDGVVQDKKFLEIINKYDVKCTFNINSSRVKEVSDGLYLSHDEMMKLYHNHEIAVHTCTHPSLTDLIDEEIFYEVQQDKLNLQSIFSREIEGMAYPFGSYDDRVKVFVAKSGIKYARTVVSTHDFARPNDFLEWHFTCHHKDPQLMTLAQQFCQLQELEEHQVFSIWGHSFEFDGDQNWDILENLCQFITKYEDVHLVTNIEAYHMLYEDMNEDEN